jgi:AcrR family transcriptional regulator
VWRRSSESVDVAAMAYRWWVDAAAGAMESMTLARIVASARECFLRQGVRKTRIADIAAGAGMVRQTVYDSVSGRDELVDLAMNARSREMADMVRAVPLNPTAGAGEQLVAMLAAMIELARGDAEFRMLTEALAPDHAFHFMVGPSALTEVVVDLLTPLLHRAASEGRLRTDVDIDDMVVWIQTLLAPLMSRDDLTPPALRRTLRLFVLPTLLRPDI